MNLLAWLDSYTILLIGLLAIVTVLVCTDLLAHIFSWGDEEPEDKRVRNGDGGLRKRG